MQRIKEEARKRGYLIRVFDGNAQKHLRVTIGTEGLMREVTGALLEIIPGAELQGGQ